MVPIELIKKLKVFREVPVSGLDQLAKNATSQTFQTGQVVCEEGQKGEGFFLIVTGLVNVEKKLFQGDASRKVVAKLGPEQFFGEMAFLQNQPYSATVVAQEETLVLTLTRAAFKDADQLLTMMTGLSDRLRSTTRELITLFEVAQIIGAGYPLDKLSQRVIEQLGFTLDNSISIGFYQWNPFNEEYRLLNAMGPAKSQFELTYEPATPWEVKNGSLFLSQIDMSGQHEGLLIYHVPPETTFSSSEKQMIETVAAVLAPALASARFREEDAARQKLQRSKEQGHYL